MNPEAAGTGVAGAECDPESPRKRPGGRSARVRHAVLDATLALLIEDPDGFTIPQVAARAGVHDATIYRRWGTREALIVAAVAERIGAEAPVPDTGSLRGDVAAFVERSVAFLASPLGSRLVRATVAAPRLATPEAREAYWPDRLATIGAIFARAVARGEIPAGVDPALAAEALLAPLYFRLLISQRPLDAEAVAEVTEFVLRAVGADAGPGGAVTPAPGLSGDLRG